MIRVSKSVYDEGFTVIKDYRNLAFGTKNEPEADALAAFNAMQQLASPSNLLQS